MRLKINKFHKSGPLAPPTLFDRYQNIKYSSYRVGQIRPKFGQHLMMMSKMLIYEGIFDNKQRCHGDTIALPFVLGPNNRSLQLYTVHKVYRVYFTFLFII